MKVSLPCPPTAPGTDIHLGPWVVDFRAPIWMESCSVCWWVILEELTFSLMFCLFASEESAFRVRVYEEGGVWGTKVSGVQMSQDLTSCLLGPLVPSLGLCLICIISVPDSDPGVLLSEWDSSGAPTSTPSSCLLERGLLAGWSLLLCQERPCRVDPQSVGCGPKSGAHIGHSIRAVTSPQAIASPTQNVPDTPLRKAWWVAWDPRGPIPVMELRECIPHGLQIHPCISAISFCPVFEHRKTTSTDHRPQHNAWSCWY